jgi:hypothetical protein
MITLAEVIEECVRRVMQEVYSGRKLSAGAAIPDLTAKYEGCIVAEGSPAARTMGVPLYRAKEAK